MKSGFKIIGRLMVSCVMQKVSRFAKNFFAKVLINNPLGFGTFFAFFSVVF